MPRALRKQRHRPIPKANASRADHQLMHEDHLHLRRKLRHSCQQHHNILLKDYEEERAMPNPLELLLLVHQPTCRRQQNPRSLEKMCKTRKHLCWSKHRVHRIVHGHFGVLFVLR